MSGAGALFYLELRMALNRMRMLLHEPGRLVLWALFLAWLGLFFLTRAAHISGGPLSLLLPQGVHLFYAFVPAAYIVLVGGAIRSGSRRPPATFAYPADARFLFGSRLNHVLVVLWLQLREIFFSGSRVFLGLFFISWNFAGSAAGLFVATAALLCAYVIAFGIRMPIFLAQRRMPEVPFGTFGVALMCAGGLTLAFPIALSYMSGGMHLSQIAAQTTVFPPGSWIVEALAGDRRALLLLAVLALAVVACGSVAATDAYPEIWEASSRLYALRSLIQSGQGLWNAQAIRALRDSQRTAQTVRPEQARSSDGRRVPAGALVFFWKDWIAMRRAQGGLGGPIVWAVAAVAAGYLVGLAANALSVFLLAGPLIGIANVFIVIGSQSSIQLGMELRRPIWWLAHCSVRDRVLAWVAGTTMRAGPPLAAGALATGIAMRSWPVILSCVPLVWMALLLVQSIGVASYVVLPGRNDLRGPGFMLRIFVTYLALAPPALAWALVQSVTASAGLGVLACLGFAACEAWLLTSIAAKRLAQNAMAYAAADAR
ncbi:MAG TPA: putative ABC exporter domain-containing protein [Candidatus Acidoferrales bacterium]|nr:putative ABC exporter domain-containing protein [Candidatus Acidoferrales bacterium]